VNEARALFQRMDEYELALCMLCNRACRRPRIERTFALVSRLGDGVFWYAVMVVLPVLYGRTGLVASAHMAVAGGLGVTAYKLLKSRLVRQRPFVTHGGIHRGTAPLDWYSFPSGHTLHAVAFCMVAVAYFAVLAWVLVPFAVAVALSRVVLGLHYPTDVLAGGAMGALLGGLVLLV